MSSLSSLYIKAETLETLLKTVKAKGEKGIELTLSINEDSNDYGQNLSAFVSQSKEQRDAKAKKYYVGNGKCFWTNGVIKVAEAAPKNGNTVANADNDDNDDLPF